MLAPDDLDTVLGHLTAGLDLIDAKRDKYREALEFYEGTRAEIASTKAIRKLLAQYGEESHPLSIAHVPVDALFDRIDLQGVTATDARANALLTSIWDNVDMEDEADDWHRKAGIFGDYYVIINVAAEDANDGTVALTDLTPVGSSPFMSIVMYDAATQRVAQYGVKRWKAGKTWKALVFYDDATVMLTGDQDDGTDSPPDKDGWTPDVQLGQDPEEAWVAHVGGRMLIKHFAVDGRPYGTPVHKKAYGAQEAITKIHAINLVNVDGQGLGARWALADPAAEIDDDIDDDFGTTGSDEISSRPNDTQLDAARKARRSIPGEIALLKGVKAVGQFDAAQSTEFTGNLEWYIRIAAVITGTPLFEFDLNGEQPSGEARRRAEGRINMHARKVQRALSRTHRDIADTLLGLMGVTAVVTATFAPTEVSNDSDGFDLIQKKIDAGMPIDQAFREAGYTDEQVADWFPDGAPNVNYNDLSKLGQALQQLAQAYTLGVITAEELHELLPTVLSAPVREGLGSAIPGVATDPSIGSIVTSPPKIAA